jgi:membrane protease YdiL (CAAX protease family)
MEYCKNCLTPIISDVEDQIYCSNQCWISSRQTKSDERWSALRVWGSIIGMFALLFVLLVIVTTFIEDLLFFVIVSTVLSAILVFFILKNLDTPEKFRELLTFPQTRDIWRLIGIVILIDVFVVKPLHVVFTTYFFPEANEQEIITALEELSYKSSILMALSVSILTPILEELLFRGFILGVLLKCYNDRKSIVISALIFAIVHEPVAYGMAFGGGLLYGWLRVKTGSIIPSTITHILWNSFVSIIVLFY